MNYDSKQNDRVLTRRGARELTSQEIARLHDDELRFMISTHTVEPITGMDGQ